MTLILSPILFVFILTLVVSYFIKKFLDEKQNLPPGPYGLPFVGYLPFARMDFHKQCQELTEKYGPILSVRMGKYLLVVLNDAESIKEFMRHPQFTGRPTTLTTQMIRDAGETSIIFRNGDASWKLIRKSAIKALALFGTSKNSRMNEITQKCATDFVKFVEKHEGESISIQEELFLTTCSMMCSLSFGVEADRNDPLLKQINKFLADIMPLFKDYAYLDFLPFLKIFFKSLLTRSQQTYNEFVGYIEKHVLENEREFDPSSIKYLSDALRKSASEFGDDELKQLNITAHDILMAQVDLFDGGFFTTAENSQWFLLLMATHKEVQEKIHAEIDQVDQPNMVYMQACLLELLRWDSSVPMALPHSVTEGTVEFKGWKFTTEDIMVLPNIWAVHYNPTVFKDPYKFQPERFLKDGDADVLELNENEVTKLMAFSYGQRRCPGESIAKQNLFVINSIIMQKFNICLDGDSVQGDPLVPQPGLTLSPKKHNLIFNVRQ